MLTRRLALVTALLFLASACSDATEHAGPPRRRPAPMPAESLPTDTPRWTPPDFPTPTPGRAIPTSRASWADGLPPLIVSNSSEVRRYRRGAATLMASVEGTVRIAFATGAATVIVERVFSRGSRSEFVRARRGRPGERLDVGRAQYVTLLDVATIDGDESLLFTTYYAPAAETAETSGYLYIQDLQRSSRHRVTEASGPEYGMTRASHGGGVIVASSIADLTEVFQFLSPDGAEVKGRPNPTDDLPYGRPPYMSDAVLSPDGKLLAYLEGPDWDQFAEGMRGNWVLVVQDQTGGRELHRVKVADGDVCLPWLDFDGRWLVLSRARWARADQGTCQGPGAKALSVAVIDSHADELELVELTDVVGVATIDD